MYKNQLVDLLVEKCPKFAKLPDNIQYIVTAKDFSDWETNSLLLVVTFYNRKDKSPEFRVFSDRITFITLMLSTGKWSESTAERLLPWRGFKNCHFSDSFSELAGVAFFGNNEVNTLQALHAFQRNIREVQHDKKVDALRMQTNDLMTQIKDIPVDIYQWINKVPLVSSRYIYYNRKGKKIFGYCTSCGSDVQIVAAKHNESGKCPNCKSKITLKSQGRSKNIGDSSSMAIVQRGEGKLEGSIIVRCFSMSRRFDGHYKNPETRYSEHTWYVIKNKTVFMFVYGATYDNFYGRYGTEQWRRKKTAIIEGRYYLYTNNLDSALKNTPWQYCQIKDLAKKVGCFNVLGYFDNYLECPSMEYMIKLKLFNLVLGKIHDPYNRSSIINYRGKNIKEVLEVDKADIPFLQKVDISCSELRLYQRVKKLGKAITLDVLSWTRKNIKGDIGEIFNLIHYTSPQKVVKYLEKQKDPQRLNTSIMRDWLDYLENSKTLNRDMKSDSILFPKNLNIAHDTAAELVLITKNEHYSPVIQDMESEVNERFYFKTDNYLIRAPQNAAEIIKEGSRLHHCVGTYVARVAKGSTNILLLREIQNQDIPFYTIEVTDEKLRQARGMRNCDPNSEVKKFLDKWEKTVLHKKAINMVPA